MTASSQRRTDKESVGPGRAEGLRSPEMQRKGVTVGSVVQLLPVGSQFVFIRYVLSDVKLRELEININTRIIWGTLWRSWLRHCATSRNVAGSIPNGAVAIFH